MGKLRLIFTKEGRAVYISHLDLLRTFQRVFIREGLEIKHSQGFHPHPIVSFAMPLSVGQSSVCEVLDFEVTEQLDGAGLPEKLNRSLPEGIRALECYIPSRPVRDLAALRARVELEYDGGVPAGAVEELSALFARDSIIIQKRTKRKELADVEIRPMILAMNITAGEDLVTVETVVAAQNPGLNPALLAGAVERYLPHLKPDFVRVHRLSVLDKDGNIYR